MNGLAADGLPPAGVFFHAMFWAVFAIAGFPATYWDDTVIVGPAVALAEHGKLTNIYLSRAFYPDPVYLFYPPTFFYVLAGWMIVFGKSVGSLSGFWAATGLISSVATAVLLGRLVRGHLVWLVAPVMVFGCIAYTGYRYEMLGFATLLAGLVLGTGRQRWPGYFLLFLTPTISPTMLGASFVATVAIYSHFGGGRHRAEFLAAASALAAAVLVLAAGVSGDVDGLVTTMLRFSDVRLGVGRYESLTYPYLLPVMLLGLGAAVIQCAAIGRPLGSVAVKVPLLLVLAMQLTLLTHMRPAMIVAFNIAIVTLFLVAIGELWSRATARPEAVTAWLALWGGTLMLLNIAYARSIAVIPLSPEQVVTARASVAAAPAGDTVVADARIIKDALGYPADLGLEDSMLRHPWPAFGQNFHRIRAHEHWVMSRSMLEATIYSRPPHASRSVFDNFFVAVGFGRSNNDGICAFNAATGNAWRSNDPADFIRMACRPDQVLDPTAG